MNNYKEFVLCYRKPHAINWDCEKGYKTVLEVDERTTELLRKNNHLTTTFFSINNYIPFPINHMMIKSNLTPKITMYNKPDFPGGEKGSPILTPNIVQQEEFKRSYPKPKNAYY